MASDNYKAAWESSYGRGDNFVFYPHEEIIRFMAKYVRKKIGLNEYVDRVSGPLRVLDAGCGIGTHICYYLETGLIPYGFDLSARAVEMARRRLESLGRADLAGNIRQSDITRLPYEDGFFDFASARGVLDSMPYAAARAGLAEISRVLKKSGGGVGILYCDLISGDDGERGREFSGDVLLDRELEKGTIQSYFNFEKVADLIRGHFEIIEGWLIKKTGLLHKYESSRYHLILGNIRP